MPMATSAIATWIPLYVKTTWLFRITKLSSCEMEHLSLGTAEYLTDLMVTSHMARPQERDLSSDLEGFSFSSFLSGLPSLATSFGSLLQTH